MTQTPISNNEPNLTPPSVASDPRSVAPDPFSNVECLRLDQCFGAELGLQRVLTSVRHGKPGRHEWVRRHPDVAWTLPTALLLFEDDGGKDGYLVAPDVRDLLLTELRPVLLCSAITRAGDPFIWEVPMPAPDGRTNDWHQSMRSAADMAMSQWVRVASNVRTKGYDVFTTSANVPTPEWPVASFQELLRLAYKDRFIDSADHPVVRKLTGAS